MDIQAELEAQDPHTIPAWTVLETILSEGRYTLVIRCFCGAEFTAYAHQMKASGKRCRECKGKCNKDGSYTAPAKE